MASSNIKLFDENKGNMLSDSEFSISTQRLNGLQTGVASSQLQNKAMYQASLVAYAIAQIMMQNGLNANDTDAVSAFVANLSGAMLQKVYDLASTEEAKAGTATGKWMSPALVKAAIDDHLNVPGPGCHNAIYRGKHLGDSVTAEQYAAINDGTFNGLYIGDYWTINSVNYRIAAFDYYLNTGDTACNTHHVTVVPDTSLYSYVMNDTNVTTGAYVNSKMYKTGLTQAKATINTAFGEPHVLNHRQCLKNAVTDGYESGSSWYDSTVELMTEQNVYGCKVFGNCKNGAALPASYTVDKSQYPLFAFRPDLISNPITYWLRDVASAVNFADVNSYGDAACTAADSARGVRPAFSIKA